MLPRLQHQDNSNKISITDNLTTKCLMIIPALCILTYILLALLSITNSDPREPPTAPTSIPYIGHILGVGRRKFNYYVDLSQKTLLPILTMRLPGAKM
ncbi:fe21a0eb-62b5-477e-a2d6-1de8c441976b-CDS [Sclerotinia trifoliorum]|uniref:Fe21a0eb-62b5-477e-a2d6-1de8c441976b-CDS n=1 Tax=Sclerotinia trifoliorum TaxID=28548 RepID=A0A8H2VTP1_9HELO|nr:fe21a0eb-62b5-477e-a2d6-1de8c441976b-CDS [Sclerotinia trifoliorum]